GLLFLLHDMVTHDESTFSNGERLEPAITSQPAPCFGSVNSVTLVSESCLVPKLLAVRQSLEYPKQLSLARDPFLRGHLFRCFLQRGDCVRREQDKPVRTAAENFKSHLPSTSLM
ncbi:MAG: hypothetical protein OXQ89_19630, partial [Rhodospirillaceae bacterium]|nr:hypothetical protein [Rhodospirillaceae bacterium]